MGDADFFRPLLIAVTFSPILLLKKYDLTSAHTHAKEGLYKFGEVCKFYALKKNQINVIIVGNIPFTFT